MHLHFHVSVEVQVFQGWESQALDPQFHKPFLTEERLVFTVNTTPCIHTGSILAYYSDTTFWGEGVGIVQKSSQGERQCELSIQ